ncbi:MAG: YciI family protein [Ferruginibacter sp.]
MKHFFILLTGFLLTATALLSQESSGGDKKPAMKDQIKQYWFVLIKTGPNTDADSTSKAILFEKHMANISKLYNDGILKAAGPFGTNDNQWRGLFIFDCATREEAENFVQTDPAVAAGLFTVEITPWYTSPIGSFKKGKPEKVN